MRRLKLPALTIPSRLDGPPVDPYLRAGSFRTLRELDVLTEWRRATIGVTASGALRINLLLRRAWTIGL